MAVNALIHSFTLESMSANGVRYAVLYGSLHDFLSCYLANQQWHVFMRSSCIHCKHSLMIETIMEQDAPHTSSEISVERHRYELG